MQTRVVMLADFDYFFAQCEELRNPAIKDKPIVVGVYSGRTEESGAVSTSNYIARKYGVKSGLPLFMAKTQTRRHRRQSSSMSTTNTTTKSATAS